jgi:RNA polymerase sigma-70 factor (ECF subfamily)
VAALLTEEREEVRLARELLAGREDVFDRFVEVFRAKIFQYSYLMCGQREDAEEISQETLLKVFEGFDTLREPERVRAWVFRIAKNACLTRRRQSVFAPREEISLDELIPGSHGDGSERRLEIADWSALPDEEAWRSELRGLLAGAVRALPDIYRSALLLRDVEGLTTEETAQVLETSLDVVKTRLHRARLMVRKQLDEALRSAHRQGVENG